MEATLDLVAHYDDPAAQPLIFKRDGTRDTEREAEVASGTGSTPPQKPRKILIFVMYDIHRRMLQKVSVTASYVDQEVNLSQSHARH